MSDRLDDIRSRLETISEELADLALVALREAVGAGGDEGGDAAATAAAAAAEKRLTRARRAVDKAASVLGTET